jgi:hypothetical protein
MGSGLAKAVGFFYFWPLTLISVAAFCACIILTRAEYDGRVRTIAGKRMVWARTFFGLGCFIYSLCVVLARKMTSLNEPIYGFWLDHWHVFLALILGAEVSMIIAMVYSFRAHGRRSWVIRTATVLIVVSSMFVSILFISPE